MTLTPAPERSSSTSALLPAEALRVSRVFQLLELGRCPQRPHKRDHPVRDLSLVIVKPHPCEALQAFSLPKLVDLTRRIY